jgi:hypothetical protein
MRTVPIVLSFCLLALSLGDSLRAQNSAPSPSADVVRLPSYSVNEAIIAVPPEPWRHGQIGEFELLSNASDAATTGFAQKLFRFQAVFRELFPAAKTQPALLITVILCGAGNKFATLTPVGLRASSSTGIASTIAGDADQAVIVIDLQAQDLDLPQPGQVGAVIPGVDPTADSANIPGGADASATGTGTGVAVNHERLLYRSYVLATLARLSPRPPAWFAEGIAQLYSRLDITTDGYRFANFNDILGGFFQQRQIMPMQQLFSAGYDSQEALQTINGTWPAQSLAFVHLCLFGEKGRHRKELFELVARLQQEPPSEKLFREIFHQSYGSVMTDIRSYVDAGHYEGADASPIQPIKVPELVLRDATDAEVGRIKGDALRLAGRLNDAHLELAAPLQRKHTDARLFAALGSLARDEKETALAQRHFTQAVEAKVDRSGPYTYLAQARFTELTASGAAPLTDAQVAELLRLLAVARAQPPMRAEVYRVIAEVWLHSATAPKPDYLLVLNEGVRKFPADADLVERTARAKLRAGVNAEATSLAALGLRLAHDDTTRARFQKLQAELPR